MMQCFVHSWEGSESKSFLNDGAVSPYLFFSVKIMNLQGCNGTSVVTLCFSIALLSLSVLERLGQPWEQKEKQK